MDKLIKNSTSYLDYLLEECGLYVSLHFSKKGYETVSERAFSELLPYICHRHPYCRFMREEISHDACMSNQQDIISAISSVEPIEHTCYAGVRELIYPIMIKREVFGFIAVSGYRGELRDDPPHDRRLRDSVLTESEIPYTLTDTLIPPLCMMIERILVESSTSQPSEFNLILNYLAENHTHVTLKDIASRFGRSQSHISHIFKKKTGLTLRAYCNSLKLADAARLLVQTDLTVTVIAMDCGIEDVSYFIRLFSERYGMTPHKYRNSKKQQKT